MPAGQEVCYLGPDAQLVTVEFPGIQQPMASADKKENDITVSLLTRKIVPPGSNSRIQTLIFMGTHPDEIQSSDLLWQHPEWATFPRLEVHHPHLKAEYLGRREYLLPLDEKPDFSAAGAGNLVVVCNGVGLDRNLHPVKKAELLSKYPGLLTPDDFELQQNLCTISRLYLTDPDTAAREMDLLLPALCKFLEPAHRRSVHLTRKVDLNRQFKFPPGLTSWSEVLSSLTYPEARLAFTLLRHHPEIFRIIAIHEDPDFGEEQGPYCYHAVSDPPHYKPHPQLDAIKSQLAVALAEHGFQTYTGFDDPENPYSEYFINGHGDQPVIDPAGKPHVDGSFEAGAVLLSTCGISGVGESWTLEIPGKLSTERKAELLAIFMTCFFNPLYSSA